MPKTPPGPRIRFYPVLHLLTGPPGLTRNGGIWKRLKGGLAEVSHPPRLMVQALHFVPYNLSQGAWEDWFPNGQSATRLARELARTYGPGRDVFVDSGGFQLRHSDKIDLSRWGYRLDAESIFRLQELYEPSRLASLDSPLPPFADSETVGKLSTISIRNAVWLAENVTTSTRPGRPYLVVHGRTPAEVTRYLARLDHDLPRGWLQSHEYGFALGSQVPLSADPALVASNVEAVLGWMDRAVPREADLHVFGVGDAIMGLVASGSHGRDRQLSYDNSTYVQKAFRLRIFDPERKGYTDLDPTSLPNCECHACSELSRLGKESITQVLSSPAYTRHVFEGARWNKSDVLALAALHNLRWWRTRLWLPARHRRTTTTPSRGKCVSRQNLGYRFPLPEFKPASPSLLLLACTKWRPYSESQTHRRVRGYLSGRALVEGRDYDRITLSGYFGPVHWTDESHPAVLNYDFPLTRAVSEDHIRRLRVQTASVLGVIGRRYSHRAAFLPGGVYAETFGPTLKPFGVAVVEDLDDLADSLGPNN